MPSLDNVKVDSLFTMFKGEPGTRKSTCALSYPGPLYWFDIDEKIQSMALPMKKFGVLGKDVQYDTFKDANSILKKMEGFQVNCPFKTLVVDSITSAGNKVNRQTLKLKGGTTRTDGSEKGMRIAGIPVNSIEDYKAEAAFFNEMIAVLKDIHSFHKVNIILIAHVIGARKADEQNQFTHHSRIIITGGQQISGMIPVYCTEVYHFNIENDIDISRGGHYGLYTEHTGNDYARTSLPLGRHLIFDDKPLYQTFIKPSIDKLNNDPGITKI